MVNLLSAPPPGVRGLASAVPGQLSQELALSEKAIHHAKRIVMENVCLWGHDDLAFSVGVVMAELLSNVMQHARVPNNGTGKRARFVVQALPVGGHLVAVVHDDDPVLPKERLAAGDALDGRGLTLVRGLAHSLTFAPAEGGKDVVAVFVPDSNRQEIPS